MPMRRRQTIPRQWLIIAGAAELRAARRLPPGSGVLLLEPLSPSEMRFVRQLARNRGLAVNRIGREAVRVHDLRELRRALLARTPLTLLSPIFPTRSHPDWKPITRMRAAALARLGGRRLLASGGMDARRFARIKQLGFQGWAGISAFRT
jgi:thiamine-phosphate pyrophosphorylase